MNIEAMYVGDNPVKVTKSMMENLHKFNTRQMQIVTLDEETAKNMQSINALEQKKQELLTMTDSQDRKIAKDASRELKNAEKEINSLNNKIAKDAAEKDRLNNIQQAITANLNGISVFENGNINLTSELNDVLNQPSTLENSDFNVENSNAQWAEPRVEAHVEDTPSDIEWPTFNFENSESENMTARRIPEIEVSDDVEFPEEDFDDIDELPVIPVYDIEQPKLTEPSINAIGDLVNKINNKSEDEELEEQPTSLPEMEAVTLNPLPEVEPEMETENTASDMEAIPTTLPEIETEDTTLEKNVVNPLPEVKEVELPEKDNKKENVDDMPYEEEITLKDYVKFPSYQAWLFTFAEEVYDKDNFTKEEILDLENKEGFVSERRFNSGRVKQAINLTNENHKLIEKTRQAIVARNAAQSLAKNLTDELNDTKLRFDDLTEKYELQSNKLADTEKTLADTEDKLNKTTEELDKTRSELDSYKTTFNKMRGIMENGTADKVLDSNKKTKKDSKDK